ncbi:hypothetical protein [Carboxylicivirga taeanensis]|uniref:hypothetical protein n=1 Tax=Carboxylicivirga taeanensis TaxID=1416875 RepID=UPI003F6DF0D5
MHREWRDEIIAYAKEESIPFTHGVSTKLINVYLKSIIICGGFYKHPNSKFIHPPIDSVLLKELAAKNFNGKAKFWRDSNKTAWSNFNSEEYEQVIKEIRNGIGEKPLWTIEEFWKGHQ